VLGGLVNFRRSSSTDVRRAAVSNKQAPATEKVQATYRGYVEGASYIGYALKEWDRVLLVRVLH
jgi:hypothetical protein